MTFVTEQQATLLIRQHLGTSNSSHLAVAFWLDGAAPALVKPADRHKLATPNSSPAGHSAGIPVRIAPLRPVRGHPRILHPGRRRCRYASHPRRLPDALPGGQLQLGPLHASRRDGGRPARIDNARLAI